MFTVEHLDGERLSADEKGWKVVEMSSDGLVVDILSDSPTLRPGRLVYGLSHGIKTYTLIFTARADSTLAHEQLVDLVNYHFKRDEPFYLYRDFRNKVARIDLPPKRALVVGKTVKAEKRGQQTRVTIDCESYELPYQESSSSQSRTWTGTHQFTNSGQVKLDPRYCPMKLTIRVTRAGNELKVLFNGKDYFWYRKSVSVGDVFVIDGTNVSKNGHNCFDDCNKRTTHLKVGANRIQLSGAGCEAVFEFRFLYF